MVTPNEALLWKKRLSMVYAAGMWTLVSCVGYVSLKKYLAKKETPLADSEELPTTLESEAQFKEKKPKPFYESHITYRKDFVPWSTRFQLYYKSIFDKGPEK